MISSDKIDEWIQEVQERPNSAPAIVRYISRRLDDLSNRNEELLDENIALRLGKKVEEYEARITNLEYQLDLLKRQFGSGVIPELAQTAPGSATPTTSLLVYNGLGQVLRIELETGRPAGIKEVGGFNGEVAPGGFPLRLLAAGTQEELFFVFDSGRAVTAPVTAIPAARAGNMSWEAAFLQEPRGSEELVTILPVARMRLAELVIQTSRRGFVKKMTESFFESCVANSYVGSGIKQKPDKTCSLSFTAKSDLFVLASKEGRLLTMEASQLPITIEPVFQIGATDHIVSTFIVGKKPYVFFVMNNGKAVFREAGWLEKATTFKTQGQPVLSKARKDAGVWIVGAGAVDEKDWCAALNTAGRLVLFQAGELFEKGSLGEASILDVTFFA
jgi:DNA gyrase/topoisomerase IV subunit A